MRGVLQTDLFRDPGLADTEVPGVRYVEQAVTDHAAWFERLSTSLSWNNQFKSRKTATFGVTYNYRRGLRRERPMADFLRPLCAVVEKNFGYLPNNCLVNYYPDGEHYISFHSDQDMEMKDRTGVTIVSLGAVREMVLRRIDDPAVRVNYALQPGSAFFMEDAMQTEWQHGIPKRAGAGPRISLSFRSLRTAGQD